jgi:ribose 5-phosphate isomerase A
MMSNVMNAKQQAAIHAANLIEDGMVVGLGTGSTADYFIEALARRQQQGLDVITVASSVVSTIKAATLGLKQVSFEHLSSIDVYVDGADEVTPEMTLLKGRGSDLVREKLLARASDQFYVLVDKTKQVERIGQNFPIPIEVMPFAWQFVLTSIIDIGGKGHLRKNNSGDGLFVTSHGSLVLDMTFDDVKDTSELNSLLNAVPGVVEHGIFDQLATAVFIGHDNAALEQHWKQTS